MGLGNFYVVMRKRLWEPVDVFHAFGGVSCQDKIRPDQEPGPFGLGFQDNVGGQFTYFGKGNELAFGDGEERVVIALFVVEAVDIRAKDVDIVGAGIIIPVS